MLDSSSEEEFEDFDYWDKNNIKPLYCKNGYEYNGSTRWCCRVCWIEQREYMANRKNRYIRYIFGDNFRMDNEEKPVHYDLNGDYKFMQIEPPITKNKLKKQYRKLALKYHPDKNGDKNMFIKLSDSYERLSGLV